MLQLTERDTNTYGIIMPAFPLTYMKLWASLTPKQWKGNQISVRRELSELTTTQLVPCRVYLIISTNYAESCTFKSTIFSDSFQFQSLH